MTNDGNIKAMRDVFLRELIPHMERDENIFFLSADFGSPVLDTIREKFPDRFINVGIAEQNLINVATGLALEGFTVYAYAIAPFITMRCYEQIRVNLGILSQVRPLNVNLVGVGAGFSYVVSGPTHQCLEDLSIMRTLPNLELFSPSDWVCTKEFVRFSLHKVCPKYIRLDAKPLAAIYDENTPMDIAAGFFELKKGKDVCVISTGYMTHKALAVWEVFREKNIDIGVIDLFMLKTLAIDRLAGIIGRYAYIITIEEGFTGKGGLDSLVLHLINKKGIDIKIDNLGLTDTYNFLVGSRDFLHDRNNAGQKKLMSCINKYLKKHS
jgi:transketolase